MKKKRTTDLFRFATLRAPELISEDRKKIGFIQHPNAVKSKFINTSTKTESLAVQRARASKTVNSFSPFSTVQQIKDLVGDMWGFSVWLNNNKSEFKIEDLKGIIPSKSLSMRTLLLLWDNLYYDIFSDKNIYIRQACLQLIVADNFKKKYKEYIPKVPKKKNSLEEILKLLRRLANGKVIIAPVVRTEKRAIAPTTEIFFPNRSSKKQEVRHRAKLMEQKIPQLEKMKKELCNYEKRYSEDYDLAFNRVRLAYESRANEIINKYFEENPDLRDKPDIEYEISEYLVDDIEFDFPSPFSPKYVNGKLSKETISFIEGKCLQIESIDNAVDAICEEIHKTKKEASKAKRKKIKSISINGFLLRKESRTKYDFALSFQDKETDNQPMPSAKKNIRSGRIGLMSINTSYYNAFLKRANISLSVGEQVYHDTSPTVVSAKDDSLLLNLFDTGVDLPAGQTYQLEASLELDNGNELRIRKIGNTSMEIASGYAVLVPATAANVNFYGVQRIGIADYRKVEQELCCYLPGEVSHIENVMAREYKERSTRHFTSTETINERTTEREMEETTDTMSTTRHEMSSEVAEVINKDRNINLGFNSSISGEYLKTAKFSVGASGDFSWGQSSSNSNALAKNYAEDVTRRALERIVQRTSLRRTSIILREFEDTNKHGYDNRKGTKHVTGVYRWINKLYKNRVVNYGKKLMYEFMIPKPAQFYAELMFSKAEESETSTDSTTGDSSSNLPVEPVHPSEHGIANASSITRDNYSNFASLYGVNAIAPLEEFSNVSDSYSESIGNTDKPKSFNYYNLRVPENYQCNKINGNVNLGFKARTGAKANIVISSASQSKKYGNYRGKGNKSGSWSHTIGNIEGQIAVSVKTKKITSFSLTIEAKCKLKASIFEQWQQDLYNEIMNAYNQQLQAYNDALALEEANSEIQNTAGEEEAPRINPLFGQEIIMTEIKRLCIEMLTAPYNIQQGKNFYEDGDCEIPKIKLGEDLDHYASHAKFFEQAFDWRILSYIFYPYYWADRCDWKDMIKLEAGNDHVFQAFLQSGMARVIVPVREGFEDAVVFYMETGKIWNGTGIVLNSDNDLYLSIVDELTRIEGEVEDEWETILPSTLTIIQAKSALLEEEGLPCCETDEEILDELNLKGDDNILELIEE